MFQYDIVIEKPQGGVSRRTRHFEERLALVEARSEFEARGRAARFFREGEVVDDGEFLQRLAIGFLGIADVLELDGLLDHARGLDEVYWRITDDKPRVRWPRPRRVARGRVTKKQRPSGASVAS